WARPCLRPWQGGIWQESASEPKSCRNELYIRMYRTSVQLVSRIPGSANGFSCGCIWPQNLDSLPDSNGSLCDEHHLNRMGPARLQISQTKKGRLFTGPDCGTHLGDLP